MVQGEGSETHWCSDHCSLASRGSLVWRNNRNSVRRGQLSEDLKVLQRRLNFTLEVTGKSRGHCHH